MNRTKSIFVAAGVLLALALTFSCSSDVGDDSGGSLTGTVSITGTAQVGQVLTADVGSLGGSGVMDIQWVRNGNVVIGGTGTYHVQVADTGSTIAVTVTRSGNSGSVTSRPTNRITFPKLTGTVSIIGTAQVGNTLTASTANLGGISGVILYQWERNGTNINGANNSTYILQNDDANENITVTVTRTNNLGSITTDPINITFSPLTGTVSITGTTQVGQILTANIANLSGSGTISYEWMCGTSTVGTNSSTYIVQADDVGSVITVTVTRTNNLGSVTSNQTGIVGIPPLTGTISIIGGGTTSSGMACVDIGQTLIVNTDNLGGSGTISYEWWRHTSSATSGTRRTNIGTSSTYIVQSTDSSPALNSIEVIVRRSDNSGSVNAGILVDCVFPY